MLKFQFFFHPNQNIIVKKNSEYLRIFHLLKWKFQNYLIIQRTRVEMAKVLRVSPKT
jgi:hypothetical protein